MTHLAGPGSRYHRLLTAVLRRVIQVEEHQAVGIGGVPYARSVALAPDAD